MASSYYRAMSLLKVQGVSKSFGAIRAVEAVSFEVRPGEIYGLLGPNGRQVVCRLALEGIMRFNIKEIWSGSTRFQLNAAFSAMGAR